MKTEQILQLVEAVSGFGLDEFEYEEDGVKLKLKKGGNVCTSVSAETAGRTKTEAEIARTEENAEVLLEGKIVKAPLVGIFYASPEEGGTPFVQAGDKVEKGTVLAVSLLTMKFISHCLTAANQLSDIRSLIRFSKLIAP